MSGDTRVAVMTPPGTGAIATVEVSGPRAWGIVQRIFRPVGKPLPETPELNRFWFGNLGGGVGDEVILAVTSLEPVVSVEIHCHGGRRVVQWVVEQLVAAGCVEVGTEADNSDPWQLLTKAPTLRTASILLDQAHGAFTDANTRILELLDSNPKAAIEPLHQLVRFAGIGRHLVEPWKVVIAGPPNVGKSSLVNALAGYQRSIVSEIAGTTRDVVTIRVAFDSWPVELTDTAGLRDAEGLEAEGIERARRVLREADLIVWVIDSSQLELVFPEPETAAIAKLPVDEWLFALNKSDLSTQSQPDCPKDAIRVSATTKDGIAELISAIASRLAPVVLSPGAAIPFSPRIADLVIAAHDALSHNRIPEAIKLLRDCQHGD